MSAAVVVFAKDPRAGLVKTRLCPPFSPEEAAELYACMLDDVLEATARYADHLGLEAIACVHPPEAARSLSRRLPGRFRVVAQHGRDLGERMAHALAEAGAAGLAPVLLRGSDSPTLDQATFEAALAALNDSDVVVCPDLDGGYSLVGTRSAAPGLFAHPMSTGRVLDDTLALASAQGLSTRVLEPSFDLDVAEDLAHLAGVRAGPPGALCRRTLNWLDEADGWTRTAAGAVEAPIGRPL